MYACLFQFCFPWGVWKQWDCWVKQQFCFQVFKNSSRFIVAIPVCISTKSVRLPFHFSSISCLRRLCDGPCDQRKMTPHCGFDLYLSDKWCCASFVCSLVISVSSLEKCLFSSFAHFVIDSLFFWYWAAWAACICGRSSLGQLFDLLQFSPILKAVFSPLF